MLGAKGEIFNVRRGKPHVRRDPLAEALVESLVVVSDDAGFEDVRRGLRPLAVKPSSILVSEGHLRPGAT